MDAKSKKKLAELEERIKQLEARPPQTIFLPYPIYYLQPYYVQPYIQPQYIVPSIPTWTTRSGNISNTPMTSYTMLPEGN